MSEVEKKLIKALKNIVAKERNLLNFINATYIMEVISRTLLVEKESISGLNENLVKYLKDLRYSLDNLETANKDLRDFQNELIYKSYYQNFEEYLSEIFVVLFSHYPIFLRKEKFDLEYDLIFEQNNVDYLRSKIIQKRAIKYVQSNNILDILKKFKTVFGIEVLLDKKEEEKLFLAARIRNILTHNNGIINEVFQEDLKFRNYKSDYKLGDSIFPHLDKELKNIEDFIAEISKSINDQIVKNIPQIEKYRENL